uniref:Uncharacterized protein n=1 Tax=Anguilla anguilla TaxID=7936 RepID=A0A0E9V7Q3_ANGAN
MEIHSWMFLLWVRYVIYIMTPHLWELKCSLVCSDASILAQTSEHHKA